MLIFNDNANAGRVQFMTLPAGSIAGELELEGWGGFHSFKSMFTALSLTEQVNAQLQHTLGRRLHVNTFGDRVGQLTLGGVSFYDRCPQAAGENLPRGHGIVRVIDFYRTNRLSSRATPLKLTLQPDLVLRCLLVSMRTQTLSVDQHTYQFLLTMAAVPEEHATPSLNQGDFNFGGDSFV